VLGAAWNQLQQSTTYLMLQLRNDVFTLQHTGTRVESANLHFKVTFGSYATDILLIGIFRKGASSNVHDKPADWTGDKFWL